MRAKQTLLAQDVESYNLWYMSFVRKQIQRKNGITLGIWQHNLIDMETGNIMEMVLSSIANGNIIFIGTGRTINGIHIE